MWHPIETAPKDQVFLAVLTCAGEQTICTMRWAVVEAKNSRPDHSVFHVERVTHWMPLPDLPGAQPAPSALAEAIIADMQAQHDSELITENDSGEALIRLDGAIAAVEDNFALAQPAQSVPEDVKRDAERYRYLRARDEGTAGVGCWLEADGRACDRGWLYGDQLDSAIDTCIEMHASAPEAKP